MSWDVTSSFTKIEEIGKRNDISLKRLIGPYQRALRKLVELLDTQSWGSVQYVLLEISENIPWSKLLQNPQNGIGRLSEYVVILNNVVVPSVLVLPNGGNVHVDIHPMGSQSTKKSPVQNESMLKTLRNSSTFDHENLYHFFQWWRYPSPIDIQNPAVTPGEDRCQRNPYKLKAGFFRRCE